MAFDDSVFISAARDGVLVVTRNGILGSPAPAAVPAMPMQTVAEAASGEAPDVGPNTPTFEECKQAAVADSVAAQAAEASQHLAAEFGALRGQLRLLLADNAAKPRAHQLPRAAFALDPGELRTS
jgi:hypothetical protein